MKKVEYIYVFHYSQVALGVDTCVSVRIYGEERKKKRKINIKQMTNDTKYTARICTVCCNNTIQIL